MRQFNMIAGLPRAGSTLLCQILASNPRFHVTPTSGTLDMIKSMREVFGSNPSYRAQNRMNIYENMRIEGTSIEKSLLEVINILEPEINGIDTFHNNKSELVLSVNNHNFQSLRNFGDAINHLLNYFIHFFNNQNFQANTKIDFILLIDEIENGIHYTAHEEFWQHLFKLCKELNVQVFATTHSLEMIKAFNTVALKESEGAYFEMLRDIDTNEIFVEKHAPEFLNFELANPKHTVRGE